jgi:hypothetical protein
VTDYERGSWSAFDRLRGLDASVGLQRSGDGRTNMSRLRKHIVRHSCSLLLSRVSLVEKSDAQHSVAQHSVAQTSERYLQTSSSFISRRTLSIDQQDA